MTTDFDIAVVGSGFAGSLVAMIARRLGRSVVLLERERHPRFAIGESSTPLANLLLEKLARDYDLPRVAALSTWGTWQKTRPEIACGLKRGFTFFHHTRGQSWRPQPGRRNELLVAASPHERIADTHWFRPEFDQFLAQQAQKLGAALLEETILTAADFTNAEPVLTGTHRGQPMTLRVGFVIDASGPRGFLHRTLSLRETAFEAMPATEGLYSHFTGVHRWQTRHETSETPPYPVDDAAVHHVFDGGWIWVLRFNNGLTSAGVAATRTLARQLRFQEGEAAWKRLLAHLPSVRELFADAAAVRPFSHAPRLSFRNPVAAGPNWALLPSAAGFVDPLLSTGFPLTLLGVARLARALEIHWDSPALGATLARYSDQTFRELDAAASLVGALYATMSDVEMFNALTLLYFAAASFSETVWRLNCPDRIQSFLLLDREELATPLRRCLETARHPLHGPARQKWFHDIAAAIQPINVAGLGDPQRQNWYPALAADLLAAAPKLGVEHGRITQWLVQCGFASG